MRLHPTAAAAVLTALWLVSFTPLVDGQEATPDAARVMSVVDGDTVRLQGGRLVRYIGIDAPETRHRTGGRWVYDPQPFAEAATAENRRRVEGRTVRLEFDQRRKDRYGRLLAYVWVDGEMVNEKLVRAGLARAKHYPPNLRHEKRMLAAQNEARAAGVGIWTTRESPGEEH
jgi:micrococcal nuclease